MAETTQHGNKSKGSELVKKESVLMRNINKESRLTNQLLSYPRKFSSFLAVLHIITGICCIVFMVIYVEESLKTNPQNSETTQTTVQKEAGFWTIRYGIWSGVLYIFLGFFGFWTSCNAYRGTIVFYGILSLLSAFETSLPFSFAVCDIVIDREKNGEIKRDLKTVMVCLVAAFSLIELILAISGAIMCFKTVCRRKTRRTKKNVNTSRETLH